MKSRIWLSSPHMGGEEIKFVNEAFDTNWISPVGPHIKAFEEELESYLGVASVAAVSSGTAAIHLALIILGVKSEDEVICSSFTFSASANPIVYLGAKPVFVDSESETWNISPDLLEQAIQDRIRAGKKPKAIILVHLYGMPAKLNELMAVAARHEIPIIEDAAESLGSKYQGKHTGGFGDIGILSFNGNKIITTSGGGAMLSANSEWISKAKFLATQARDQAPHYEHSEIGYNYRLSNVCAGIGRGQLKVLGERVRRRREIFEFYRQALSGCGFEFLKEPENALSNRWLTTVLVPGQNSPERVRQTLEAENIESRPLWKPMHLQPVFKGCNAIVNGTSEGIFKRGLCLPSGSNLQQADLTRVVEVILKIS